MMASKPGWQNKFVLAAAGLAWSVRTQSSFWIHLPITVAVLGVAAWLRVETWRWVALVLAITIVLSAELLNTAIEQLVKVLHSEHDDRIGRALDTAAGAVFVAAIGAVIVGLIALAMPLWTALRSMLS